uniref:Putative secreted protein n=1 Tax=Ixodes ricinus TaxID=34613 RepID=A0A6B0UVV5_IXORI
MLVRQARDAKLVGWGGLAFIGSGQAHHACVLLLVRVEAAHGALHRAAQQLRPHRVLAAQGSGSQLAHALGAALGPLVAQGVLNLLARLQQGRVALKHAEVEKDVLVVLFVLNEAEAFLEGGNVAAVRVAEAVAAPGTTLARLAPRVAGPLAVGF